MQSKSGASVQNKRLTISNICTTVGTLRVCKRVEGLTKPNIHLECEECSGNRDQSDCDPWR